MGSTLQDSKGDLMRRALDSLSRNVTDSNSRRGRSSR